MGCTQLVCWGWLRKLWGWGSTQEHLSQLIPSSSPGETTTWKTELCGCSVLCCCTTLLRWALLHPQKGAEQKLPCFPSCSFANFNFAAL